MIQKTKKIKMLFEGSVLSHYLKKDGLRSGIYFITYNILKKLDKYENIDITVSLSYNKNFLVSEIDLLKKDKIIPENCKVEFSGNKFTDFLVNSIRNNEKNKNDNLIKKIIRFIAYKILYIYYTVSLNLTKSDYDVYFSTYNQIPNNILHNKKILSYQIIHDLIPIVLKDFYKKNKLKRNNYEKVLYTLDNNRKYFAVSEYTKQDMIKYLKIEDKNIIVMQLGANEDIQKIDNRTSIDKVKEKYHIKQNYVFSLCTLEPRKNLSFTIRNFIEFLKIHPDADIALVLSGGCWNNYNYIPDINPEYKNKVIITGYVDDSDLSALYSGADFFVFPSLYEGFGLPVLEAMQCGCPVITSNVSSLPEVIGDCGIMIDPASDYEIIKAYEKMYYDKIFRDVCAKKGLERAKKLNLDIGIKSVYEQIRKDLNNETII